MVAGFDIFAKASRDAFGVYAGPATYAPKAGPPVSLTAIYRGPTETAGFGGVGFRGWAHSARVLAADIPRPERGAQIEVTTPAGLQTFDIGDWHTNEVQTEHKLELRTRPT